MRPPSNAPPILGSLWGAGGSPAALSLQGRQGSAGWKIPGGRDSRLEQLLCRQDEQLCLRNQLVRFAQGQGWKADTAPGTARHTRRESLN